MVEVIEVEALRKRFGRSQALDGLDLAVRAGEVHGFLGPNGAGKSTTIRILLGLVRADGGTVRVLGGDPRRDATAVHERLAYVPGDVALWPDLSGGEIIDLLLRLRGRSEPARRDELIERFALDPTKRARTYSKGNRQKVALVAAFAAPVDLLVLDEPTSGLDPLMEDQFRRVVREVAAADGTTVLLSSHILSEVEALCERVTIIRDGRTVEARSLDDLRAVGRTRITAEVARPVAGLDDDPNVHDLHVHGATLDLAVDRVGLAPVLARITEAGVRNLVSRPPTLEELFLSAYEGDPAGEGR